MTIAQSMMNPKKDINTYNTRETLLAKLKNQHDDKSWEEFFYFYKNYIYAICRRMNLTHHDAEEQVQKVLMVVWRKLPDFEYDRKRTFRGWLSQVTHNHVLDFYRHTNRQNNKVKNATENTTSDQFLIADIDLIAEEEWKAYIATMALDNIRSKFSESVIDIFVRLSEGQSRTSVAEEFALPPNTISVYKNRVMAMMRKEIRRLYYELGEI